MLAWTWKFWMLNTEYFFIFNSPCRGKWSRKDRGQQVHHAIHCCHHQPQSAGWGGKVSEQLWLTLLHPITPSVSRVGLLTVGSDVRVLFENWQSDQLFPLWTLFIVFMIMIVLLLYYIYFAPLIQPWMFSPVSKLYPSSSMWTQQLLTPIYYHSLL